MQVNSLENNDLMSLKSLKSASRISELLGKLTPVEKALYEFKSWKKKPQKNFDLIKKA